MTQIVPFCRYQGVDIAREGSLFLRAAGPATAARLEIDRAFEDMYLATWPRLCRYAWVLVHHHEDAEDVAAEAVRRAYAAWQAGRAPSGDPVPWLFLIARRIVIDRNKRRMPHWLSLSGSDDPRSGEGRGEARGHPVGGRDPLAADSLGPVEAAMWFDQLRDCMSSRQHEAIVLRFLFDLADDQIGRIMGLSPAGVRTNVSRGVAALRRRPEVLDR
jgi:RNA polymerase sigma factor (sigma-70 family)